MFGQKQFTSYVAGLLFDPVFKHVALILKQKGPPALVGKWNAIGGKVELNEDPLDAMVREFHEETGITVPRANWHKFATLEHPSWGEVLFFMSSHHAVYSVRSMEAEPVCVTPVGGVLDGTKEVVPNLRWLIPMALSLNLGERAKGFVITEVYES